MLITSSVGIMTIHYAYGQASQVNSDKNNNANLLNVQNIPAKKVHVGDMDIAYKVFGKGKNLKEEYSKNVQISQKVPLNLCCHYQ